jgi:hypothetical protein
LNVILSEIRSLLRVQAIAKLGAFCRGLGVPNLLLFPDRWAENSFLQQPWGGNWVRITFLRTCGLMLAEGGDIHDAQAEGDVMNVAQAEGGDIHDAQAEGCRGDIHDAQQPAKRSCSLLPTACGVLALTLIWLH